MWDIFGGSNKPKEDDNELLQRKKAEAALRDKASKIVITTGDITSHKYTIIQPVDITLSYVGDATKNLNQVFQEATAYFAAEELSSLQMAAANVGADAVVFAKSEIVCSAACGSKTVVDTGILSGEKWGINYDIYERYLKHWCGTAVKMIE